MAENNGVPDEAKLKQLADTVIHRALVLMMEEGVPFPMMMDRLLTAAGAHIAAHDGSERTAAVFRQLASNIDSGCFDRIDGKSKSTLQ